VPAGTFTESQLLMADVEKQYVLSLPSMALLALYRADPPYGALIAALCRSAIVSVLSAGTGGAGGGGGGVGGDSGGTAGGGDGGDAGGDRGGSGGCGSGGGRGCAYAVFAAAASESEAKPVSKWPKYPNDHDSVLPTVEPSTSVTTRKMPSNRSLAGSPSPGGLGGGRAGGGGGDGGGGRSGQRGPPAREIEM